MDKPIFEPGDRVRLRPEVKCWKSKRGRVGTIKNADTQPYRDPGVMYSVLWDGNNAVEYRPEHHLELASDRIEQVRHNDATCIYCGCTDSRACPEGCSWFLVDRKKGLGICSQCMPVRWRK